MPRSFSYGTYLCGDDVDGFKLGYSIAVGWTASEIKRPSGERGPMPEVRGISGGGMWLLHDRHDPEGLAEWDPNWIRLAGIEHTTVKRKWRAAC